MNVIECKSYACADCGRKFFTKEAAELCCKCSYCGKLCLEKDGNFTNLHGGCNHIRRRKLDDDRFEKAEKVCPDTYEGFVYCEQVHGGQDGYFRDLEELVEAIHDGLDDENEPPKYCFCCTRDCPKIDAYGVYERVCECGYEDMMDDLNGTKEFEAACKAFNEANKGIGMWDVDYRRAIVITPEMLK